jgi:hydrogenase expression/formation protein HypE
MVIAAKDADKVLSAMHEHELGRHACVIGEITSDHKQKVLLETGIGGKRVMDMLTGEQLPRIC